MKCHYTYYLDKGKKKKTLIPGCYQATEANSIDACTCKDITPNTFEKKRYNEILAAMQQRIKSLEDENKYLMDLIKQIK